jgi:hypothetical protein
MVGAEPLTCALAVAGLCVAVSPLMFTYTNGFSLFTDVKPCQYTITY